MADPARHSYRLRVNYRSWSPGDSPAFALLLPVAGILRSSGFARLWLDRAALVRGDMLQVLAVLAQGLASAKHAAFVQKLRTAQPDT